MQVRGSASIDCSSAPGGNVPITRQGPIVQGGSIDESRGMHYDMLRRAQMIKITKLDVVRRVAAQFKRQYFRNGEWSEAHFGPARDHAVTHQMIVDAGDNVAAIDIAIGSVSWTRLKCDECDRDVLSVVQLGQEPDYESATANVCFDCIRRALLYE